MGIVSDGTYGIPKGLVYSYPVKCSPGFEYEVVRDLKIDSFSQEKMDATTKELLEEKAEALGE